MKSRKKNSLSTYFSFFFTTLALGFLVQCAGQPGSNIAKDTLIYARGGDAVTLDPGSMEDGLSANVPDIRRFGSLQTRCA